MSQAIGSYESCLQRGLCTTCLQRDGWLKQPRSFWSLVYCGSSCDLPDPELVLNGALRWYPERSEGLRASLASLDGPSAYASTAARPTCGPPLTLRLRPPLRC